MASSDLSAMLEQLRKQRRAQLDQIMQGGGMRQAPVQQMAPPQPYQSAGMGKSIIQNALKSAYQSPKENLGVGAAAQGLQSGATTLSTLPAGTLTTGGIVPGTAMTGATTGGMSLGTAGQSLLGQAGSGLSSAATYILSLL